MELSGIILIDKDKGMYSNRVVEKVRRLLKGVKVGHLGTLDPLCTGLLPLCIGRATRLSQILMKSDKVYQTTLLLGIETNTFDIEGEIIGEKDVSSITLDKIKEDLKEYMGQIQQVPPYFSAKKFKGRPLYKYARAGEFIELKPATVTIYSITVLDFYDNEVQIDIHCSVGTYVRSLAHDLGKKLGCGACCKEIRRIKWKNYDESRALTLKDFCDSKDYQMHIIP